MRRIKLHFFPLAAPLGRREILLMVRPQSPPRQGGLRRSRLDPDRNQTTRALVIIYFSDLRKTAKRSEGC
jgi:hypothetical protein